MSRSGRKHLWIPHKSNSSQVKFFDLHKTRIEINNASLIQSIDFKFGALIDLSSSPTLPMKKSSLKGAWSGSGDPV